MRRTSMAARGLAVALAGALCGCANLQSETRVERGPSLRTFEREGPASPGGVEAIASAQWPRLTLAFTAFEVCHNDKVEEYVEERVTEVSAPAVGPALGTGVTATLAGAALVLGRGLFQGQPDTRNIDATGHYGPSQQQVATGWGTALLVVGVPALATAFIQLAQTGEKTEQRKQEAVVSSLEAHCHLKPVSGTLQAGKAAVPVADGRLELTPDGALRLDLSGPRLDSAEVELTPAAEAELEAFRACARALPAPVREGFWALKAMDLAGRLDDAKLCRRVPGAPAEEAERAYEQELNGRRERGEATVGPVARSFDEAMAVYPPELRFTGDSPDLEKLEEAESLAGKAAYVRGILGAWVEPNIAAVDVGGRLVWMFVEGGRARMGPLEPGSRVEAVAVMAGRQTLGAQDLPLLRVVWMRPAM